jgi:hypothetical protein
MHKIGLALVLTLCCLVANAADFTLAGDNGLSGTVTIDTAAGVVTVATVAYGADTFTFNVQLTLGPGVIHIQAINAPGTKLLHLLLASSSLVRFTGATLCGTDAPCGGAVSEVYCLTCPPSGPRAGTGALTQLDHVTLQ